MINTYTFKKKKYYEIYINKRLPNGKRLQKRKKFDQHGKRISSPVVAHRIEYELKKELDIKSESVCLWTWADWHKECLKRMKYTHKKSTIMGYDGDLKKWFSSEWNERAMTDFIKGHVYDFLFSELSPDLSQARRKTLLKRLHKLFELALEEGIINQNPAKGIKVKVPAKEQKVFSSNDVENLLYEAKQCNHRFYHLWAFALFTGMRNGEIYAVRHSDIDFESGLVHVNKQFTSKDGIHETKGNCNRVVPISNGLRVLITEMMNGGGHKETLWKWKDLEDKSEKMPVVWDDLLLPRFKYWRGGKQSEILKEFCQTLQIPVVKFHDLRATFITNMLSRGVPLTVVMKIVGHSQMSTTDEYNRLAGVEIKGYTEKLGYSLPRPKANGNVVPIRA